MRTLIPYYGGKTKMLKHTLPLFPTHTIYIEPFFGGGAEFFAKDPSNMEIINDTSAMVVNFFRVLRDKYEELEHMVNHTLFARDFHRESDMIYRVPEAYSDVQRAWAFWCQTNMSFGHKIQGGFRINTNSTDISHSGRTFKNSTNLLSDIYKQRMHEVNIENRDAVILCKEWDRYDTFHRQDPPYIGADMGPYKGYTDEHFIEILDFNENMEGRFLLSSYDSDILEEYVERNGWNQKRIRTPIQASPKVDRNKVEVLTWNYDLNKIDFGLFNNQ